MEFPFLYLTVALSLGIIIGRYVFHPFAFLLLLAISVAISLWRYLKNKNVSLLLLISFIFVGAILSGNAFNSPNPYLKFEDKFITINGKVYEVKEYEGYAKYIVKPPKLPKVLVTQYGGKYPSEGDIVSIRGIISIPQKATNPGGFDYKLFLKKKGIYAVMRVQGYAVDIVGKGNLNFIEKVIYAAKQKTEVNYINSMPERDAKFVISIFLGDKLVDDETLGQFRTAGISHIISVSGMHVAIITGFILYMLSLFNIRRYKVPIIIIVLTFYAILTGANPPVIRAALMASIALIGTTYGKKHNSINSLSFAAFVILIFNPLMLWDVGFQLSFVATLAILYFYKPIREKLSMLNPQIRDLVALTLSAQIGTIPFTMYYYHYISIISLLSNIVIVPLANIAVVLGFLSAMIGLIFPPLSYFINYINIPVVEAILYITKLFNSFPYASINTIVPPLYVIVLYYGILTVLLSSFDKKTKKISIAIALTFVIAIFFYNYLLPKDLEVTFLDVGQGDSTFVRTPHGKTFLIDGGGKPLFATSSFDVGEDLVLPFLYYKGVMKLDGVFISHTDIDHIGGIITVLQQIKVDKVFIGVQKVTDENFKKMIKVAKEKNIPVIFLKKGDKVEIDNIEIYVLHPDPQNLIEENPINNNALVFKMKYKEMEFLFTGDIEKPAEEVLKNLDIKTDILKVAHHGSNTSSTQEFIEKANPKVCIVQVGKNSYGLPDERVLKYLQEKAKVYRTDKNGAIIVKTNGERAYITTFLKE
ncbi:competence protein ComEC [Thermoanaerobacter thermohydrosulfuricus]|uniref:Competence protein ComEC n=1 Tax=Thermoanaerobacter thermohydrosulfuricus TaxID=1516 RepID=A0A1G7JW06_THETY|nr:MULTISPECIES: DNA internalization-related competence protein ComEC/Rec2 [Thermoanaerobacter]SDF29137.1 competence protein ComEC [Thermoanaerobacter thermohydrosulfuricus]